MPIRGLPSMEDPAVLAAAMFTKFREPGIHWVTILTAPP